MSEAQFEPVLHKDSCECPQADRRGRQNGGSVGTCTSGFSNRLPWWGSSIPNQRASVMSRGYRGEQSRTGDRTRYSKNVGGDIPVEDTI